jgi:hypothetical protein
MKWPAVTGVVSTAWGRREMCCVILHMLNGTSTSAAVVVENAPLWVVADMVQAGQYDVVLVLTEDQRALGLVRCDAILRLAPRLPQAPIRMLPLQKILEVPASVTLGEAQKLLKGDVEALLVQKPGLQGWTVLTHDDLFEREPIALSA